MAHHFSVAIELKCEVREVIWSVGRGRPSSWRPSEDLPSLGLTMTSPPEHAGEKLYLGGNRLPSQLKRELLTGDRRLSASSRKLEIDLIVGSSRGRRGESDHQIDPWALRSEFLSLDRKETSNSNLVRFLNQCGQWSDATFIGYEEKRLFPPGEFWSDRHKLISAMKLGTSHWDSRDFRPAFDMICRSEFPHLITVDRFCLDAIFHSVTIDLMSGVKHGLCAREDCRRPFSFESRHERLYCGQYCGHLVSVRKRRTAHKRRETAPKQVPR